MVRNNLFKNRTKNKINTEELDSLNNSSSKKIEQFNEFEYKDILNTPIFKEVLDELSQKESIVVNLKLGYSKEKNYTTSTIADFMDISEQDVIDITIKAIEMYKEKLNKSITNDCDIIQNNNKTLKKI